MLLAFYICSYLAFFLGGMLVSMTWLVPYIVVKTIKYISISNYDAIDKILNSEENK